MTEITEVTNSDTGRFLRCLIDRNTDGNAEYDREHLIVPTEGGYVVGGIVQVGTLSEARELVA